MSVDTKVFVMTDKTKILDIMADVKASLDVFCRQRLDKYSEENGYFQEVDGYKRIKRFRGVKESNRESSEEKYSNGVKNCYVNFFGYEASFQIVFGCGDKYERLMFVSGNDCDYSDTAEGYKFIFSVGCWGSNQEIAKILCEALTKHGDTYYDLDDCDMIDFQKYGGVIK